MTHKGTVTIETPRLILRRVPEPKAKNFNGLNAK